MKYQSENTNHVLSAIDEARQSFLTIEKSGINSFLGKGSKPYEYSTLANIFDAIMESLYQHKLSVHYQTRIVEVNSSLDNILTTTITHLPSGQFITSASRLGANLKSQELGSAMTYQRRYQIQAMLNLEADFEDEGNLASNANAESTIKEKAEMPKRKYVQYDKDGNKATEVTAFNTYMSTLNAKDMKQHHSWCSQTIIQLQDIKKWASELDEVHKTNKSTIVKHCDTQIKFIKGGANE